MATCFVIMKYEDDGSASPPEEELVGVVFSERYANKIISIKENMDNYNKPKSYVSFLPSPIIRYKYKEVEIIED